MTATPYQLLPPLDDEEYAALKDSIATFGVLHPVVLDEHGTVIDGHHRQRACDELGITDYPRTVLPGLTDEQKIEQALTLNLARRHLSSEQKQDLVSELRQRGLSVRTISERTGIPRSTVGRYASGVPGGTPGYVTGGDGKRYHPHRHDAVAEKWQHKITALLPECRVRPEWPAFYPTPQEYRTGLNRGPLDVPPIDISDEMAADLWFREHLPAIGTLIWFQTGEHPPPPPLHLVEVLQATKSAQHLLAELDALTALRTGQTLKWLEDHGMLDDDGQKIEFLPVDPDRFAACECTWCGEVDTALAAAGKPEDQRHVAAIGHAYFETGWNFAPEAAVS